MTDDTQLPATTKTPLVADGASAIMMLVEKVTLDSNFDVAKLEHLLAVQERWEANAARRAFVAARAAFMVDAPTMNKDKQVGFASNRGGANISYRHTTLGAAAEVLAPLLAKHGLAYSWETEQLDDGTIRVTCVMTHKDGHSERVRLQAQPDNTGNKNSIQAVGSTVTYLERYTLLAITGTATKEQDDDGIAGGNGSTTVRRPIKTINANEEKEIEDLLTATQADRAKFLAYFGCSTLNAMPAKRFESAKNSLLSKQAKQAEVLSGQNYTAHDLVDEVGEVVGAYKADIWIEKYLKGIEGQRSSEAADTWIENNGDVIGFLHETKQIPDSFTSDFADALKPFTKETEQGEMMGAG